MYDTRYHNGKLYVPRVIREKLKLSDGDTVRFDITKTGDVRLVILRSDEATERILHRLDDPPDLGEMTGTARRMELYEDIA